MCMQKLARVTMSLYRLQIAKTPPSIHSMGFFHREPGNVLLSLEIQPTIIGAEVFHCPVRNGKEWDHHAMVTRLKLVRIRNKASSLGCVPHQSFSKFSRPTFWRKLHGYRIKLHEQLVLVSLTPHSAYTPNLSTSWSRTTL